MPPGLAVVSTLLDIQRRFSVSGDGRVRGRWEVVVVADLSRVCANVILNHGGRALDDGNRLSLATSTPGQDLFRSLSSRRFGRSEAGSSICAERHDLE